jgi:hypothetical protein
LGLKNPYIGDLQVFCAAAKKGYEQQCDKMIRLHLPSSFSSSSRSESISITSDVQVLLLTRSSATVGSSSRSLIAGEERPESAGFDRLRGRGMAVISAASLKHLTPWSMALVPDTEVAEAVDCSEECDEDFIRL